MLQPHFTPTNIASSLPADCRTVLQKIVDNLPSKYDGEDAAQFNAELKSFYEKHVAGHSQKLGAFVGVLRELRPAISTRANVWNWWHSAVKHVISSARDTQTAVEDAREYLSEVMLAYDTDTDEAAKRPVDISERLCRELLSIYIAHTGSTSADDQQSASHHAQVAGQVEDVLTTFGRKRPKDLFHGIDDLLVSAKTRLQALTLLSLFLRHQAPHLYLVMNTPLVEHLLKCLMNDTSTTLLSVALTCLIMLLPHIPGSLGPHLPRMFLIYSRLLAWEKFSATSTEAQRILVTDDRVPTRDSDHGDVGIDPTWEKVRPTEGTVESFTPHLLTYFTYLYGLYPLNFMSYIRKPRRYLKNTNFPGADAFDLDQVVIRKRSDQFCQVHLLHPNLYNMNIEEELADPKWPRMDPADVVGECHSLCINRQSTPVDRNPDQSTNTAHMPAAGWLGAAKIIANEQYSPSISHSSPAFTNSPGVKPGEIETLHLPPTLRDVPKLSPLTTEASSIRSTHEKQETPPNTDLTFLQQQLTVLRNDLNFERWHKAQYSQHISQLMRKNVKDATIEAETLSTLR